MGGFWQRTWALIWDRRPVDIRETSETLAQERGARLLAQNLSPLQRQQLARHKYFDVIGGNSGARYRIHAGRTMNVAQLSESGESVWLLCFEPRGRLPLGDVMLAQKIALELFEAEALRRANVSPTWMVGLEHRRRNRYMSRLR